MKKFVSIILLLIALFFVLYKRSETSLLQTIPQNTLVVFSQRGCPHCHEAITYINDTLLKKHPNLKVEILDIRENKDNMTKLYAVASHYHMDIEKLGTPIILFNNKFLMGWTEKHQNQLERMFKKM